MPMGANLNSKVDKDNGVAVGSFAVLFRSTANTAITAGSTIAGSGLWSAMYFLNTTPTMGVNPQTMAGTWRAMGACGAQGAGYYAGTTFQRIA